MKAYPDIKISKDVEGKPDWWTVVEAAEIPHPIENYTIPKGYRTDLISSPWLLYPIIQPHAAGAAEAIAHDYEHDQRLFADELGSEHARHLSNLLLAVRMICRKAPIWKVFAMLIATTLFSRKPWNKKSKTPTHETHP